MTVKLINRLDRAQVFFYISDGFCWYMKVPESEKVQTFRLNQWLWEEFRALNPEIGDVRFIEIVGEVADAYEPPKPDFSPGTGGGVMPPASKQKYFVYIVAGNACAVGYDESPITQANVDCMSDRIKQLGFNGDDNLKLVPLGPCAQNFQDMSGYANPASLSGYTGSKGIHLPLAAELLNHIPADTNIIIIPAAHGGTGFNGGVNGTYEAATMKPTAGKLRWGATSPFYEALMNRLKYVLDMGDIEAKYAGFVWCAGEQESQTNGANDAATGFDAMLAQFATDMESYKDKSVFNSFGLETVFTYETTSVWYTRNSTAQNAGIIWGELRNKLTSKNYVAIPRTTSTNNTNGTGATSSYRENHFGNNAYTTVIAPRVKEAIINASPDGVYSNVNKPVANPAMTRLTFENGGISKLTDSTGSFAILGNDCVIISADPGTGIDGILNQRTLLFGSEYKMVIFRPQTFGFWTIIKNDTPTTTGSYGLIGMKQAGLGALTKVVNKVVESIETATTNMTFTGSDLVLAFFNDTKIHFARKIHRSGACVAITDKLKSRFVDVTGVDRLGITYGYSTGREDSPLLADAPINSRVLAGAVGVIDPSVFFADINNPTSDEYRAIFEAYETFTRTY